MQKLLPVLIFLLTFLIPVNTLHSQDIEDIAFFQSQELRKQLGLSFDQTQKMEESLRYFGEAYKRLVAADYDENQTFKEKYELLKQERETELKSFLDKRQLELFNVITEKRTQYFKDFYESTRLTMAENPDLAHELAAYNHHVMLPELLRYRAQLDESIGHEDSVRLAELSREFNEILDDFLSEDDLAQFTSANVNKSLKKYSRTNGEHKKNFKEITKLLRKYKDPLNDVVIEIDPLEIEWRKDIINIVNKYLPYEEQEAFSNTLNLMGAYGISQNFDSLVFLLFDPSDENSFFVMKRKLYRIFFKDMI